MDPALEQWERAEKERSAYEASQTCDAAALAAPRNVARYFNPPSETVHPLEYAFHLLGDVRGKTILEYGCGDGSNTVLLANRGANVISLDLSPELINVARARLRVHGITSGVKFIVGSAHNVPLPDESVDIVFGIAILHHLDLALSSAEVKRLLKKGGIAIFQEPVRNSWLLRTARHLIPYRAPDVSPYERPLTDKELRHFAASYTSYLSRPFTLPTSGLINLLPLIGNYAARKSLYWDAALLGKFPSLGHYSSVKVLKLTK
jgi:ubiquinone/menaquinone biosynthesis C-methylase UbiE